MTITDPPESVPPQMPMPPTAAESRRIAASARQPLWDVTIALHIASRHETDKLASILTSSDQPPILAVMCEPQPNDTRWVLAISIGVRAPSSLAAIIRAGRHVRRACKSLGFDAHMTKQGITVGPSTL